MPKIKQKPKPSTVKLISEKSKKPIPSSYKLARDCIDVLYKNWRTVAVILLIYFILTLMLSSGIASSSNISQIKSHISSSAHGGNSSVKTGFSIFSSLIGSTLTSSISTGDSQTLLFIVFSLVIIWLLRQFYLGKNPMARDALYKSLYPLIPFFLIFLLLCVELVPATVGTYIYALAFTGDVVAGGIEKVAWVIILLGLIILSLYLFVSSVFALYIVTLPDMRPVKALRSSWGLVKKRRLIYYRKVLFLPVFLAVAISLITIFFIIILPSIAGWVFLLLIISSVAVSHSYMYALYRESL